MMRYALPVLVVWLVTYVAVVWAQVRDNLDAALREEER